MSILGILGAFLFSFFFPGACLSGSGGRVGETGLNLSGEDKDHDGCLGFNGWATEKLENQIVSVEA